MNEGSLVVPVKFGYILKLKIWQQNMPHYLKIIGDNRTKFFSNIFVPILEFLNFTELEK